MKILNKFIIRKILVFSIFAVILICSIQALAAASLNTEKTILIACSDYQNSDTKAGDFDSYSNGEAIFEKLLNVIHSKFYSVDGFICGGDFCKDLTNDSPEDTAIGINSLLNTLKKVLGDSINCILIQGNHDNINGGVSSYGAHEFDTYSIYALNEDYYCSYQPQSKELLIMKTANELDLYLSQKAKKSYNKPIFICSHVPLHYSNRTPLRLDNVYAKYIFDVINKYGDKLNLFFLYGHNHNHGYNDYIGGASQFLTSGDNICLPDPKDTQKYNEETLNFTYMNYGYLGFYYDIEASEYVRDEIDAELTMTSFEIEGNKVTINRWDKNGLHQNLKSRGYALSENDNDRNVADLVDSNELIYTSPQVIDKNIYEENYLSEELNSGSISVDSLDKNTFDEQIFYDDQSDNDIVKIVNDSPNQIFIEPNFDASTEFLFPIADKLKNKLEENKNNMIDWFFENNSDFDQNQIDSVDQSTIISDQYTIEDFDDINNYWNKSLGPDDEPAIKPSSVYLEIENTNSDEASTKLFVSFLVDIGEIIFNAIDVL